MPLPLLLAGGVLVAAAVGVGAAIKSKMDSDEADDTNEQAQAMYDEATENFDRCRRSVQSKIEKLNEAKLALIEGSLTPFVETFSRIKNVDYAGMEFPEDFLVDIERDILETRDNATLAWLGGGSLAAGGMGVAGGTAVLGGIVAAPVLLVGGLVLASRAAKAKEDAGSNLAKAEAAAEAMQTAEVAVRAIGRIADQTRRVLLELREHLERDLAELKAIVADNEDYRTYSRRDKELGARMVLLYFTAKNVAEAPLSEEDGAVTDAIGKTLRKAKAFLKQIKDK